MAWTGPGSGEWIEEQYRKARWREIQKQAAAGGLAWRTANNRLKPGDPGYAPAPTTPNSPNRSSGGPRSSGPSAEQMRQQALADQRAAEARAEARAKELRTRAGERSLAQAANLEDQAKALRHALDVTFKKSLDQNLSDVGRTLDQQLTELKTNYGLRRDAFRDVERDTEDATAGQAESSFANLVRERQDTMTGLLTQGAGETDALRAMVIAARNWRDNVAEGNRSYFDSMRSVRSGMADLASDTRSAMANAQRAGESERERLWQNYYDRRSETFTQLGNLRQQQADYYASAQENEVGLPMSLDAKRGQANTNFMNAAKEAGESYVQKGVPKWITTYGQADIDAPPARQANTDLAAAMRFEPIQQAEGATLRSWT